MKKRRRRPVTLIEIMIVIVLIALIGGALAFNMRGSMDKGRQFKTDQNISRVENILEMELAQSSEDPNEILQRWVTTVTNSPLASGIGTTRDGWNQELQVTYDGNKFVAKRQTQAVHTH